MNDVRDEREKTPEDSEGIPPLEPSPHKPVKASSEAPTPGEILTLVKEFKEDRKAVNEQVAAFYLTLHDAREARKGVSLDANTILTLIMTLGFISIVLGALLTYWVMPFAVQVIFILLGMGAYNVVVFKLLLDHVTRYGPRGPPGIPPEEGAGG